MILGVLTLWFVSIQFADPISVPSEITIQSKYCEPSEKEVDLRKSFKKLISFLDSFVFINWESEPLVQVKYVEAFEEMIHFPNLDPERMLVIRDVLAGMRDLANDPILKSRIENTLKLYDDEIPKRGFSGIVMRIVQAWDLDGDGAINEKELRAGLKKYAETLSSSERRTFNMAMGLGLMNTSGWIKFLDSPENPNGKINFEEIMNFARKYFDINNDGVVSFYDLNRAIHEGPKTAEDMPKFVRNFFTDIMPNKTFLFYTDLQEGSQKLSIGFGGADTKDSSKYIVMDIDTSQGLQFEGYRGRQTLGIYQPGKTESLKYTRFELGHPEEP